MALRVTDWTPFVCAVAIGASLPSMAAAQAGTSAPPSSAKWEIEFHVGALRSSDPSKGAGRLPAPDVTFNTINVRPTRRVPSWFFGDGALLLNQVNAALGLPEDARIVPLDAVLTGAGVVARTRAGLGVRVNRRFGGRFSAEFAFDARPAPLALSGAARDGIAATATSFEAAWQAFFARFGVLNGQGFSFSEVQEPRGWETMASAAAGFDLLAGAAVTPFVAGGISVIFADDRVASAVLSGVYFTRFPNGLTSHSGQDTIQVRWTRGSQTTAAMVGGGVRGDITSAVGWRVDARALIAGNRSRVTVTALPSSSRIVPGSAFATGTTPGIQLSSIDGVMSSLSGAGLRDFETFTGSGRTVSVTLAAGIFTRVPFARAERQAAERGRLEFGVKGGITAAKLDISDIPDEIDIHARKGGSAGIYLSIPTSMPVSFQPEILFSARGARMSFLSSENVLRFTYLDFPMLARIDLMRGRRPGVFWLAGLTPALRFEASAAIDDSEEAIESETRTFDLGATIGGGIAFGPASVELRYTWGLLNVDRVDENERQDDATTVRHRTLAVLVGFRVW